MKILGDLKFMMPTIEVTTLLKQKKQAVHQEEE